MARRKRKAQQNKPIEELLVKIWKKLLRNSKASFFAVIKL